MTAACPCPKEDGGTGLVPPADGTALAPTTLTVSLARASRPIRPLAEGRRSDWRGDPVEPPPKPLSS